MTKHGKIFQVKILVIRVGQGQRALDLKRNGGSKVKANKMNSGLIRNNRIGKNTLSNKLKRQNNKLKN
jgi:hypothetical protein